MRDRHIIVTLIHGTWAQNAPWTRDGSYLRKTLEDALRNRGANSVTFRTFLWSGSNSHEARADAGKTFRERLGWWIQGDPDAMHFVIAHSHGGNVALHAILRSRSIRDRLDGLICIATPFLQFHTRNVGWLILPTILSSVADQPSPDDDGAVIFEGSMAILIMISLFFGCITTPIFIFIYLYYPEIITSQFGANVCRTFPTFDECNFKMVGGVALITAIYFAHYLSTARKTALARLRRNMPTLRSVFAEFYYYFQPKHRLRSLPILALSSAIDEAFVGLTGSWWVHRVSGWMGASIIITLLIALYIGIVFGFSWLTFKLGFVARAIPSGIMIMALMLTLLLTFFGLSKIARILRYTSLGVGPGLLMGHKITNYYFKVKAMRDPGLPCSHHKRYTARDLLFEKGFLFHSRIYANKSAIEDMAAWMETASSSRGDISEQPRLSPDGAVPVTSKDDERDQQP